MSAPASVAAEPAWLRHARALLGVREIAGPRHSPVILRWLEQLKAWWRDDETPWCGAFVAICLAEAGFAAPPAWFRARAWGAWGVKVAPRVGALLVFARGGGGHVGWYVGEDGSHFHVLGGNQANAVSIARIDRARLIACRWPADTPVSTVPRRVAATGRTATRNEA